MKPDAPVMTSRGSRIGVRLYTQGCAIPTGTPIEMHRAPPGLVSIPAFWAAATQRRTSSAVTRWVTGRAATALLARRRPPSEPEQPEVVAPPEGAR